MDLIRLGNFAFFKYAPLMEGLAEPIYLLQIEAFFGNIFYTNRDFADHPSFYNEKFKMAAFNNSRYNPIFLVINPDEKSLQLQAPIPILDVKGYNGYKSDGKGDYKYFLQTLMTLQGKMRRFVFDRLKENGAIFSGKNEVLFSLSFYFSTDYVPAFNTKNQQEKLSCTTRLLLFLSGSFLCSLSIFFVIWVIC